MTPDIAKYTLRTNRSLLKKLNYIASNNGRSVNKEIEQLLKQHVQEFERTNGVILMEE